MTQWDDPQNRETRAYPRGGPQGGDPYARNDQYGYNQGYEQNPQARRRFEDSQKNPFGAASDQAFGIAGTVTALLGGILGVVVLTSLQWFGGPEFDGGASFGDVGKAIDANSGAAGFASAYFGWLAWVFLVVAVVAAVMASFPSAALRAFRVIGTVIGFAAAGLSFLALQIDPSNSYLDYLKSARIGFYLMVIAFILAGVGSAIGPRKV